MTKDGESTMQKVKDVLHIGGNKDTTTHNTTTGSDVPGTTHTGHAEGSHGPHSSSVANAADPRVDSDLDGNRLPNKTSAGYGTQDAAYGTTGAHNGTHNGTHVPGTSTHTGTTHTGTTGTHTGTTGTHIPGTTHTGHAEGSHGPHGSAALNAADPRVDSDLDGNRLPNKTSAGYGTQDAYGTGATGTTGTHHHQGTTTGNTVGGTGFGGGISHSTNAGPHNSNAANAADPRVDSDLSNSGNRHGASKGGVLGASGSHATPGSGTAQNTAGPHNSDMLNKADPRVDADLDGSKTFGGNKTHY